MDAAAHGETVLLATPWSVLDDLATRVALAGMIVIDATNPFVAGGLAQLPAGKSAGAVNAERFAGATLVKAFNTYTSGFQAAVGNGEHGHPVAMFLSGDDADTKQVTQVLVRDSGFEPVDLGGLRQMPLMEAPRRQGAVYGEAYSPDAARRVARAASTDLAEAARLATLLREVDPQEADRT